ncbi:unnamed protein product [Mesocestoides corti]|uniref:Uncharacterized protein n=2 Tax=Mesocestoides corti TaxID=53468 RepID=A0A158QSU7_MESCO|nr:unnamed protein product [Mesocestoides corti]
MVLSDVPPISLINGQYGNEWLRSTFKFGGLNTCNTLFIQLLVVEDRFKKRGFFDFIRVAFRTIVEANHFLFIVPETINYDDFDETLADNTLRMRFKQYRARETKPIISKLPFVSGESEFKWEVFHFTRQEFDPALCPRIAKVKDNDDLTLIFNAKSDVLQKIYGEFYIAELVEAQNDNMKAVSLESENSSYAVGFMNATTLYDAEFMNSEYDLQPFNYLMKHRDPDTSVSSKSMQYLNAQADTSAIDADSSETEMKSTADDHVLLLVLEHNPSKALSTDDLRSALLSDAFSLDRDTRLVYVTSGNWVRRHLKRDLGLLASDKSPAKVYSQDDHNAFIIQLYGILPEFENRAKDFLPFMFNQFPNVDYAVISVPRLDPETVLLQEFYRAKPRPNSSVTQELYVYHRANLVNDFHVRPAIRMDQPEILNLTRQMHPFDRTLLTKDLNNYMKFGREPDGNELICYVAICLGKIVGVLIARVEERFKLNTLVSCLGDLYAVRPRRQIVFSHDVVKSEVGPQSRILHCPLDDPPPALYHISRNLIMEPKLVLNARVVVVGASSTSLAFLEHIIFASHIRFNNLTLLTPHGIPGDTEESENRRVSLFFPPQLLHARPATPRANSTTNQKLITIDGTHEMSYDLLVLAPGTQYHPPMPTRIDPKVIAERRRKPPCEVIGISTKDRASNLFLLNDEYTTLEAIRFIEKNLITDKSDLKRLERKASLQTAALLEDPYAEEKPHSNPVEGPIIVFGDCVNAYSCVYGLLNMGVPGVRIVMMHPCRKPDVGFGMISQNRTPRVETEIEENPSTDTKPQCHSLLSVFDDYTVESAVHEEMQKAGVRILRKCVLVHWNNDPNALSVDEIKSGVFIAEGREVRIRCVVVIIPGKVASQAFFSFAEKKVDRAFFKAVNDACLVFDKQLVIDTNFHTSDPSIRAAGPATKYRRIYYNDKYTHALCNSLEVGERLAKAFLTEFDPNSKLPTAPTRDEHYFLPVFKMPRVVQAVLPGGYNYLKVWKPGYKKNVLLRGSTANFTFPVSNYVSLYSTHEKAVNDLVSRYDDGLIEDFYSFFGEPWAMALFHDRFEELKQEIHDLGCKPKDAGAEPLIESIRMRQALTDKISEETYKIIRYEHLSMGLKYETEKRIINFIENNYDLLPIRNCLEQTGQVATVDPPVHETTPGKVDGPEAASVRTVDLVPPPLAFSRVV